MTFDANASGTKYTTSTYFGIRQVWGDVGVVIEGDFDEISGVQVMNAFDNCIGVGAISGGNAVFSSPVGVIIRNYTTSNCGAAVHPSSTIASWPQPGMAGFGIDVGSGYETVVENGNDEGSYGCVAVDWGGGASASYNNINCHATKSDTTFYPAAATTGASGNGTTATVTFSGSPVYATQTQITLTGMTPACYNGTQNVTASSAGSVSFASTCTGAQTVAGQIGRMRGTFYPLGNITGITLDGTKATVTFSYPSGTSGVYPVGTPITLDGAPVQINGLHWVSASSAGSISFASTTTGTVAASGQIGERAQSLSSGELNWAVFIGSPQSSFSHINILANGTNGLWNDASAYNTRLDDIVVKPYGGGLGFYFKGGAMASHLDCEYVIAPFSCVALDSTPGSFNIDIDGLLVMGNSLYGYPAYSITSAGSNSIAGRITTVGPLLGTLGPTNLAANATRVDIETQTTSGRGYGRTSPGYAYDWLGGFRVTAPDPLRAFTSCAIGDYCDGSSFRLDDSTNVARVAFGFDPVNGFWGVQSLKPSLLVIPLLLNPSGGTVGVGRAGSPARNDTNGFFAISKVNGQPSGVPADVPPGMVPMRYDATNHRLWIYDDGWKSVQFK